MESILSEQYNKLKKVNPNLSFELFEKFEPTLKIISSRSLNRQTVKVNPVFDLLNEGMRQTLSLEYDQLKQKDSKLTFEKFLMLHNLMVTKKLNIRD